MDRHLLISRLRVSISIVIGVLSAGALLLFAWLGRADARPEPVRPSNAVGDATCLSCHRDKASFEGTAHRRTTSLPTHQAMSTSFRSGENPVLSANRDQHFRVDADSTGYYQTAVLGSGKESVIRRERVSLVVGSGRKGQTFLYWRGDQLFQLPLSFWNSVGAWIMSPGNGYGAGSANFERGVAPRCLECHATWVEPVPELAVMNRYRADSAIMGITCERCHASGREHVARERSVLHSLRQPAIVNAARMTREQKMDACAQCHGGLGRPIAPEFSYVVGQRLSNYLALLQQPGAKVDVHGNQVALLSQSKCYRSSQMTCVTCHDVHTQQRNPTELSGRCLACHQEQSCSLFAKRGHAIAGRCVDCHMPLQESNAIVSTFNGKQERAVVRTHLIRAYPEMGNR
jgi:hypothetical protein